MRVKAGTQVLFYAEEGSEVLSFGFANRSAAFYSGKELELSLSDATRAIESGYPRDKIYKVYQRRGLCNYELRNFEKAQEDFERSIDCLQFCPSEEDRTKEKITLSNHAANSLKAKLTSKVPARP